MAEAIVRTLRSAGYEAYFVGGCVRDLVLGRQPGDYDIVTSALPADVQALFPVTYPVGASFGVVLVVVEGRPLEVATYRKEDAYLDGRRPSVVTFGSLEEDVRRRVYRQRLVLDPRGSSSSISSAAWTTSTDAFLPHRHSRGTLLLKTPKDARAARFAANLASIWTETLDAIRTRQRPFTDQRERIGRK
jgi:tRNA nucleotidyltransferase/poly(A) polymerase